MLRWLHGQERSLQLPLPLPDSSGPRGSCRDGRAGMQ